MRIMSLIGRELRFWMLKGIYYKRMVSEMIHMKYQNNGINLQTDTESLNRIYFSCLKCS